MQHMKKFNFFICKFFNVLNFGYKTKGIFFGVQFGIFKFEIKILTNTENAKTETSTYKEDSKRTRRRIGFNQDLDVGLSKYSSISECYRKMKLRDDYCESSKYNIYFDEK